MLNSKYNKDNENADRLKNEYVYVFNMGIVIMCSFLCVYYSITGDFLSFLIYNYTNYKLILIIIGSSVFSSLANSMYFSIITSQGPLIQVFISSFRKSLSIILSLVIYQKPIDMYKGLALLIVFSLIIYEIYSKSKKVKIS